MRTWQQTAQQLPVQVRPIQGETTISYVFRLAGANDLARPTILLGALGQASRGLTRYLIDDYDVHLNPLALQRLETFAGTPQGHLKTVLPGPHHPGNAPPTEVPAIRVVKAWNLRDHCDHCTARLPGRPAVKVYTLYFPTLCREHRRWLATKTDLTNTPEIITAHRRHGRLLATTGDRQWTYQQLHRATWIVSEWARRSFRTVPRLHDRWQARGRLLAGHHSPFNPSDLLVYPEAVALAEIFCDLEWRRHVAMVRELEMPNFYRRIAARLNQPRDFADWLGRPSMRLRRRSGYDWVTNPIQQWISQLRHTHRKIRTEFYERHNGFSRTPFPETRHFK
ncbi:hypothetical protein D7147_11820 [Micromonospora musae]|uniref:TniQ family protein n=1 Tax=Micromonospora musae TaxID=1894970 RepID=A0ABX9RDS4_9ACTN|nr:hypothetical protein [Micromonospora musae]RKN21432.1 hypothetical protein D7147_11820 [Micromonospora musae]